MRKIFTLAALMLFVSLGTNAQWRKTWDFSKGWSEATKANLNADTENWGSNRTDASTGETTGWKDKKKMSGTLKANGVEIEELRGIDFQSSGLKGGDYLLDPTSIRMSREKMAFKLPKLAAGQMITMVAKSANGSATDRGFVGDDNLEYVDGPANGICLGPDGYQTLVWKVKETVEDSVEVMITCSPQGGLDIQSIIIDEGDAPAVEEDKKVLYVTNSATLDGDYAYDLMNGAQGVALSTMEASSVWTVDSLQAYDAVVISPFVSSTDAIVPTLKSAIAYQPILNLNPSLYEAWGYGKAVTTGEAAITVVEGETESDLFTDMSVAEGVNMITEGTITGVELSGYFANDKVIGKVGETVAIHQHNPERNTYLLLPLTPENAAVLNIDEMGYLLPNAVQMVARTKKEIVATGAPSITKVNKHKETVVTMSTTNDKAVIYYTLDKSEPTTASTKYTEPFTLTDTLTVKAIATLDGYLNSKVAELKVDIKEQAAAPVITVTKKDDSSEVTITCATEGVDIYYSYNAVTKTAEAQKYDPATPIVVKGEPTGIFAFAASDKYVQSEMASAYVEIPGITAQTIRLDTLAHFDANQEEWFLNDTENGGTGEAKTYYYWGKSAWEYYSSKVIGEQHVTDSQGKDSTVYIYEPDPAAVREAKPNTPNGWILKSAGQVLTGELTDKPGAIVGNGETDYYAETAEDLIGGAPTKGKITFGAKSSGNPYTGSIETTDKYTAPFDVVTYVANGSPDGKHGILEIQVSADGVKWDSIGTVKMSDHQRYYKKTRVSHNVEGDYYVRVAQVGGSTKAQVYDIYILNNGEVSQKYDPAVESGIESVNGAAAATLVSDEVFSVNGARLNSLQKGLNIVRKHYSDGSVKTVKVIVR